MKQLVLLLLVVLVVSSACSSGESSIGGSGLPAQQPGETYQGPRMAISGEVRLASNGCVSTVVDGSPLFTIWPQGSEWSGEAVALSDGAEIRPGDTISATGAAVAVEALPGWPDGRWGNDVGYCDPDARSVLVIDEVG